MIRLDNEDWGWSKEVEQAFGISRRSLKNLRDSRRVRYKPIGKIYLYHMADVEFQINLMRNRKKS